MIKFLYKTFLKPILFKFDPEFVHNQFTKFGQILGSSSIGRKMMEFFYDYKGKDITKEVDGIKYRTPVLLSAGFDYNGELSQILPFIGFGGEEVGTVTARSYDGNAKPRLTRLPKNKSIIVNKGLKNEGVDVIIERLRSRKKFKDFVLGISVGMTNDGNVCDMKAALDDFYYSLEKLIAADIGDYYTLNISCPNAHWGENFALPNNLKKLFEKISDLRFDKPLYIKMPINTEWKVFEELLDIILKSRAQGVIIGNLNKNKQELEFPEEAPAEFRGNLSGRPTFRRSNELIKRTKEKCGDELTIIGCGGILSAEDAMTKFDLGSDLVMLISGMILEGPHLMSEISEAYAKRVYS